MLYNLSNQLAIEGFSFSSICNLILAIFRDSGHFYGRILPDPNQVQRLRRKVNAHLAGSNTPTREAIDRAIVNACKSEILMDLIDGNLRLEVQSKLGALRTSGGLPWQAMDGAGHRQFIIMRGGKRDELGIRVGPLGSGVRWL